MLAEQGLTASQIAQIVYNAEWDKLNHSEKTKLINRVLALLKYANRKFYGKIMADFMANELYEDNIDDHGGTRKTDEWTYSRNGTADIVDRKRYAVSDLEKYRAEYERILYFFYERTLGALDYISKSLWNRVVVVHMKIFSDFWRKYGKKISFNRKRLPEIVAAYVYIVFFGAYYNMPIFYELRYWLDKLLKIFIRDPEKYREYLVQLLPLILDFIA